LGESISENAQDVHAAIAAGVSPPAVAGSKGGNQMGNGPASNNGIGQGDGGGKPEFTLDAFYRVRKLKQI
jgi:hypothetical protein